MGSTEYIENNGRGVHRTLRVFNGQPDVDCPICYRDEDLQEISCILPIGHDGKHVDPTGIEF